jgi:Fe-S cluster assembly protein SufB
VTQRGIAHDNATIEWVDCNIGSKVTMKYPCVILKGNNSHGEVLSMAMADEGQWLDTGAKMLHSGKNSSSIITTKSICKNGGKTSYRGKVTIPRGSKFSKTKIVCDALIMDSKSQTNTYPYNEIRERSAKIEHEANVSKVSQNQLYYLESKGLSESEASGLIVSGFIEPITKELPLEFAMEMNNLIQLSMEGSVG